MRRRQVSVAAAGEKPGVVVAKACDLITRLP